MDCLPELIQCDLCDFTTNSKYRLSKHHRKHVKNEGFLCPTCPKTFSRKDSLNEHIKVHGRELYGRKFTNEEKIEAIELTKDLGILDVAKKYKVTEQTIKYWMKLVTSPFYCSQCNYSIYSKSRLKNHEEKSHMNLFPCDNCQYVFKRTSSLKKHQHKLHGGDAPKSGRFVCSDCPKSYIKKINLENHKKLCTGPHVDGLETKEKAFVAEAKKLEFVCSDCPKSYRNKYNFNNHKKVCAGSSTVAFQKTDKSFVDEVVRFAGHNSVLLAARKYKVPEITVKGWLQRLTPECCLKCKRTFYTKSALLKHNKRHHSGNYVFRYNTVLIKEVIAYTINHTVEETAKTFSMSDQNVNRWLQKERDKNIKEKSSFSLKEMYESRHGGLKLDSVPERKIIKVKVEQKISCDQCEFYSRKRRVEKHKLRKHMPKDGGSEDQADTKKYIMPLDPVKTQTIQIKEEDQDQPKLEQWYFSGFGTTDSKVIAYISKDGYNSECVEFKDVDNILKVEYNNEDVAKTVMKTTRTIKNQEFSNEEYENALQNTTFIAKDIEQGIVKVDQGEAVDDKSSCIMKDNSQSIGSSVETILTAEIKSFDEFWSETQRKPKEEESKEDGKTNICPVCSKVFRINYEMKRHILRTHSEAKHIACDQCVFRTKRHDTLLTHMKTKHDLECEKHICTHCGKVFKVKGEMTRHINKIHKSPKDPFSCFHCKRIFTRVSPKIIHERSCLKTSKDKSFMCHLCDSAFYKEGRLKQHIQRHDGSNKVKCHLCEKKFATNKSRKMHVKIIHEKCKANFLCSTCSKSFTRLSSLNAHRQFVHDKQRPVSCETCDSVFKDNRDKDKHKLVCMGN